MLAVQRNYRVLEFPTSHPGAEECFDKTRVPSKPGSRDTIDDIDVPDNVAKRAFGEAVGRRTKSNVAPLHSSSELRTTGTRAGDQIVVCRGDHRSHGVSIAAYRRAGDENFFQSQCIFRLPAIRRWRFDKRMANKLGISQLQDLLYACLLRYIWNGLAGNLYK